MAKVSIFELSIRSSIIRFLIFERDRTTEPVGVSKTASGRKSLATVSVSFLFQAETKLSTTAETNFRSSESFLPSTLLVSALADNEPKKNKEIIRNAIEEVRGL